MQPKQPKPLFDTLDNISEQDLPVDIASDLTFSLSDFDHARKFLTQFNGSKATFESYRRELERLLQWAWFIEKKSIVHLDRSHMDTYLQFCFNPPKAWIGTKRVARFINEEGLRKPNPEWRLFVAAVSKAQTKEGIEPDKNQFRPSQQTIAALFAILGSFYNYLLYENIIEANPIAQIRQKSKYFRKQQSQKQVRRLSELQWHVVLETAEKMASEDPVRYERTLFILSAMYLMYLRISELVATERWMPIMGHFFKDSQDNWWFKTVGKGNKERDITVSDEMLKALKRYRKSLGLFPDLPYSNEQTPLITAINSPHPITSDRPIRYLIQECFDRASQQLKEEGFHEEASALNAATVHWLRHTGISDDINKRKRPIAHVRDDAGHSSSAITDRYNDAERMERHASGRKKAL